MRARFWPTMRKALRSIPFMEDVIAAYYAMLDPATPTSARLTLIAALAYFVAPFDVVPDMIAVFGFADDATVLLAAISAVGGAIRDEHREAARRALAGETSRRLSLAASPVTVSPIFFDVFAAESRRGGTRAARLLLTVS